jgi:hypothetical protein
VIASLLFFCLAETFGDKRGKKGVPKGCKTGLK